LNHGALRLHFVDSHAGGSPQPISTRQTPSYQSPGAAEFSEPIDDWGSDGDDEAALSPFIISYKVLHGDKVKTKKLSSDLPWAQWKIEVIKIASRSADRDSAADYETQFAWKLSDAPKKEKYEAIDDEEEYEAMVDVMRELWQAREAKRGKPKEKEVLVEMTVCCSRFDSPLLNFAQPELASCRELKYPGKARSRQKCQPRRSGLRSAQRIETIHHRIQDPTTPTRVMKTMFHIGRNNPRNRSLG
jgi:hypothetical protein